MESESFPGEPPPWEVPVGGAGRKRDNTGSFPPLPLLGGCVSRQLSLRAPGPTRQPQAWVRLRAQPHHPWSLGGRGLRLPLMVPGLPASCVTFQLFNHL